MIFAKRPLQVSLAEGSTDLQDFIYTHGYGGVISHGLTLLAYISVHKNNSDYSIVNYSKQEEVEKVVDIKNDIARKVEGYLPTESVTMTFNSDTSSHGTGFESSSAFAVSEEAAMAKLSNAVLSIALEPTHGHQLSLRIS